ncbi:hypothetical protein E4U41_007438 [Claviceps citrina]|nr:hypothetical protein E4U41_007438 [Claviceps citrina]
MGSQINDAPEFVVLVTGFQPFRPQWPVNPSWEIAKALPSHLPPRRATHHDAGGAVLAVDLPPVRILVHPEPVRVSYRRVRELVPSLWDTTYHGRGVDAVLHMGMAGARSSYEIERRAHRRGYRNVDVDYELPEEGIDGRPDDPAWEWYGLPDEIVSDLDVDDVHGRWRACSSKDMDLRVSENAGRFLCDWIYYCSLSHQLRSHRPKKACFLHVPCASSEADILRGRDLTVNLIRAIAESEVLQRRRQEQEQGQGQGQTQTQTQTKGHDVET